MTDFVPPALTGLWRREVITAPKGYRDDTTKVLWLQTRSWYADIRIRADRPTHPGATGFDDFSDEDLRTLAAVEGFCGELTATGDVCLWRRDLDYQPPSPSPDEAKFAIEGDVMIEDGIHSDYQEVWRREPGGGGPLAAFQLIEDADAPGRGGLLVTAGDHFMQVLGRRCELPDAASLKAIVDDALQAGRRADAVDALSMNISYGRIGPAGWKIEASTYPWLEGGLLWSDAVQFDAAAERIEAGRQVWSLADVNDSRLLAQSWVARPR